MESAVRSITNRFQVELNGNNHSLDNTTPSNITALKGLAASLIENESGNLEKLCKKLVE